MNTEDLMTLREEGIFEVNGSFEPSKFKAKLYNPAANLIQQHQAPEQVQSLLESGDVIRLLHKEANG